MRNLINNFSLFFFAIAITFSLTSCEEVTVDPNNNNNNNGNSQTKTGNVSFEATDGPIDDATVEGAFVTITEIKIDGETYEGFSGKQTIDLLAYQNGNTKALGLGELEVGTYTDIALVLDYETDMDGNSPGCYVLTTDDVKHELSASTSSTKELILDGTFMIEENTQTDIVMDFDLRKAITHTQDGSESNYQFVTDAELESAIRVMNKAETGNVEGEATQSNPLVDYGDKIVVYAYKEGTFNSDIETQGQGQSQVEFANAETSAVLDAEGNYTLSFLEDGNYELHFISYEDTDNDGSLEIKGMIQLSSLINLNLNSISVEAGVDVTVDVSLLAVLPI